MRETAYANVDMEIKHDLKDSVNMLQNQNDFGKVDGDVNVERLEPKM